MTDPNLPAKLSLAGGDATPSRRVTADRVSDDTLAAYIDGRLAAEDRRAVDAAVAADPEAYAWLVEAVALARELPDDPAATSVALAGPPTGPERRRWWPLAAVALATAAMLVLLLRGDEPGFDLQPSSALVQEPEAQERALALTRAVEAPRALPEGVRSVDVEASPGRLRDLAQALRTAVSFELAAALLSRQRPWDASAALERARARRLGFDLSQTGARVLSAHLMVSVEELGGRYAVFARWPEGRLAYDVAMDSDRVRAAVVSMRSAARQGLVRTEAGNALSEALLTPIRERLARASTVVVCAGGVVGAVPWALLPDPEGGLFVERHTLTAAPWCDEAPHTVADWRQGGGQSVVAGSSDRTGAPEPTSAVPAAAEEVAALARELDGADVLSGDALTREALLLRLPRLRLLHFAGDAVAHAGDASLSRLLVSPSPTDPQGALFAGDILGLRLPPAVVVLSAGETPFGVTSAGDGMSEFADAFLRAGAASVVTSSWRSADHGTIRFFTELHRRLPTSSSVADTVRATQLWARRERISPAVWGAVAVRSFPQVSPPGFER